MEHEAQPHQGDQHQLIEKEVGDHGKIPSYRWRNEGILPGFAGYRISRKIEVQDRYDRRVNAQVMADAIAVNRMKPVDKIFVFTEAKAAFAHGVHFGKVGIAIG